VKRNRNAVVVVGGQWGDEGKGKVVDLISPAFDLVARYQGGHNAGHTVKFEDRHFALRLIPSGICRPGVLNLIGNGLVIDPRALLTEMDSLVKAGVPVDGHLRVSDRAHVILPTHALMDGAREKALGSAGIGTTSRGIGPTYETKAARTGVRMADLIDPDRFVRAVRPLLSYHSDALRYFFQVEAPNVEETIAEYVECGRRLAPLVTDVGVLISERMAKGARLLCEGAQGLMLDLDHGTYPFVTSSSCGPGGAVSGLGLPPSAIGVVVAVMKAYTTRVGSGPFPTELHDEIGERIRTRGGEFGTVTGRPRRTGWFDAVVARTAVRIGGLDALALTKVDILDQEDPIRICTGYQIGSRTVSEIPARTDHYEAAKPVYRDFPGWKTSTAGISNFDELPEKAKHYLTSLEEIVGCRIALVGTGAKRNETILRAGTLLDDWLPSPA
jgi:adenylosuccinate synthase